MIKFIHSPLKDRFENLPMVTPHPGQYHLVLRSIIQVDFFVIITLQLATEVHVFPFLYRSLVIHPDQVSIFIIILSLPLESLFFYLQYPIVFSAQEP